MASISISNGQTYHNFVENVLPELLEGELLHVRPNTFFMHDGAPPHFSVDVRRLLDNRFRDRWIDRRGPPDLNPQDAYLWGHLKVLVYRTPIQDLQSLRARIMAGCETIRNTPGIFQRIRDSIRRRVDACINAFNNADGWYFEHLL